MKFKCGDKVKINYNIGNEDPLYDEDIRRVDKNDVGYIEDVDYNSGRAIFLMSWNTTWFDEDDDECWIYGDNLVLINDNSSTKMLIRKVYGT